MSALSYFVSGLMSGCISGVLLYFLFCWGKKPVEKKEYKGSLYGMKFNDQDKR